MNRCSEDVGIGVRMVCLIDGILGFKEWIWEEANTSRDYMIRGDTVVHASICHDSVCAIICTRNLVPAGRFALKKIFEGTLSLGADFIPPCRYDLGTSLPIDRKKGFESAIVIRVPSAVRVAIVQSRRRLQLDSRYQVIRQTAVGKDEPLSSV